MRELARRLLVASPRPFDPHTSAAPLVNEKLCNALRQFTGADGFASLLRRALALASAEVPALRGATVCADGRLEGVAPAQPITQAEAAYEQAAIAVTAQMLALLVTFIGESLTRRLVREACPETSLEE